MFAILCLRVWFGISVILIIVPIGTFVDIVLAVEVVGW